MHNPLSVFRGETQKAKFDKKIKLQAAKMVADDRLTAAEVGRRLKID